MSRLSLRAATSLGGALLILTACGGDPAPTASTPSGRSTPRTADPSPTSAGAEVTVGDHELFVTCTGTGSPTVVLEPGDGVPSDVMHRALSPKLSPHVRVCSYDRTGTGQSSGEAPRPRQSREILADLRGVLDSPEVPGPHVLVGHSAGAMIVQSYALNYPDSIAGVVAMNPVPPWRQWRERALPEMTKAERAEESAYFGGEGSPEGFDFREISGQYADLDEPAGIPFRMLISTATQCESPDDVCGRTYPATSP
jgi:pimeloyl-ACP methyl ester carboxylesterase